MFSIIFSILIALLALVFAGYLSLWLKKQDKGSEKMQVIFQAIKEGADAFLKRQYQTITIIVLIIAVSLFLVYFLNHQWLLGAQTSMAFIFGAFCSLLAGLIGMRASVQSNIRVAAAAQNSYARAFLIALRGGAISGLAIVAISLIGIAVLYLVYIYLGYQIIQIPSLIIGYSFGASLVALFALLGGGIYTKAADVGADLVGKIEAGIPEDDPRNPAVIADLVGDNVGDCAGRGADLFESIAAQNIGAMLLGVALFPHFGLNGILFPLVLGAFGLLASLVGIFMIQAKDDEQDPLKVLKRGYFIVLILATLAFYFVTMRLLGNIWFFYAGLAGILASLIFVYITQYYTEAKYRPVREIVKASETGHATNIIAGLSVGFECVGVTVLTISATLWGAYRLGSLSGLDNGGLFGTAVATMGMLITAGYILAMDVFGPITDNAGGIVEMSGSDEKIRRITDKLDAAGNTTKALTKGYAMGSAALAAFLLFSVYLSSVNLKIVDLAKVEVFIGAMIGAMLVFVFSSLALRAVGRAASYIIKEVRRQFKEIPGLMEGKAKPNYARCIDITTKGALKQMVFPGILAVVVPVASGLILRAEAAAGLLMVGTISGVILATVMNNGGGAWDNAKKYVEEGHFGGKGSMTHKSTITGDTVGDPFKDTAGPSLNVLIKLISTLTLVLAALFI